MTATAPVTRAATALLLQAEMLPGQMTSVHNTAARLMTEDCR